MVMGGEGVQITGPHRPLEGLSLFLGDTNSLELLMRDVMSPGLKESLGLLS